MYCTSCGSFSPGGSRFCSNCGKEQLPPLDRSKTQSTAPAAFGAAIARVFRQLFTLPSWALLLLLLVGASALVRFVPRSTEGPAQGLQTNHASVGQQQSTSNPANQSEPQITPAETFALALRETLQPRYRDIDVGVINHVLSLISDSFRDRTARDSQAKDLLKNRASLCGIEIWTLAIGYSRGAFSKDAMEVVPLGCVGERTAHEQALTPRREKFAAELSDANLHVSTNGGTLIFDSELFSDFDARAAFLQQMRDNPYYNKLYCELEFAQMELRYRTKTMRRVPIVCK
jgi:hypothetical protein